MTLTRRRFFSLATSVALLSATGAAAQTYTWVGLASDNWSNAANWSGGVVPVSGTTANLVFNSILDVSYVATNDIASPFVAQTITVNNQSANATSPNGVRIAGPLQLSGATHLSSTTVPTTYTSVH